MARPRQNYEQRIRAIVRQEIRRERRRRQIAAPPAPDIVKIDGQLPPAEIERLVEVLGRRMAERLALKG